MKEKYRSFNNMHFIVPENLLVTITTKETMLIEMYIFALKSNNQSGVFKLPEDQTEMNEINLLVFYRVYVKFFVKSPWSEQHMKQC